MLRRQHLLRPFALIAFGASAGHAIASSFRVWTGSYGPQNEVHVARPSLKWEIWPQEQGGQATDVDLRLNGSRVSATYSPGHRAVEYTPSNPLRDGTYEVKCAITFEHRFRFSQSWVTRISRVSTTESPISVTDRDSTVQAVNALRKQLNLPNLVNEGHMSLAALKHSQYLAENDMVGHGEVPGTPDFFGNSPSERLAAFGWTGTSWEDVSYGPSTVETSVRELFDAPYHRIPFMQPGEVPFGSGFAGKRLTIEFGGGDSGSVVSPADGQQNVPTCWVDNESPSPLRMHGATGTAGYPIVFAHFTTDARALGRVSAELYSGDGSVVPCYLNTPSNDPQLREAAILIPKSALKPHTAYRVVFTASGDDGPVRIASNFTTR